MKRGREETSKSYLPHISIYNLPSSSPLLLSYSFITNKKKGAPTSRSSLEAYVSNA